jgi:hypothetical protein
VEGLLATVNFPSLISQVADLICIGVGIAGRFNGWGEGVNNYGKSIQNATAPNAGGTVPVKKTTDSKQKALPSSSAKKALPASKQIKALPAPPAKKDTATKPLAKAKTSYTPPAGVAVNDRVKKAATGTNGKKKVTPEKRSLPGSKPATDPNALKAKTLYTPASGAKLPVGAKTPKPAIPGFGFDDKASKAGSVADGYKPSYSAPTGGNKTSAKTLGPKPAIPGYGFGDKTTSKAGTVAGSVAGGGPKFF